MIVMTYTAARVKQEIAKEGILPYPRFFAQNTDLSLGRLLAWLRRRGHLASLLQKSWLLPEHHSEKTPVGAFVLHFLSCLILIFATWGMTPDAAYELLTTLCVYVLNCFFGFWVGLGILILRWKGPPESAACDEVEEEKTRQKTAPRDTWSQLTGRRINPYLSVFCASFFTLCNAWPVITVWIPPAVASMEGAVDWYLVPTVAWAVIVFGVAWYVGFLVVAGRRERKHHEVFVVEKKPEFESDGRRGSGNGEDGHSDEGLVLIHETTYLSWVGKETLSQRRRDDIFETNEGAAAKGNNYAGTDFDGYFQQPQQQTAYEAQQQPSPMPPQGAFQAQVHPPQSAYHPYQQQPQEHFAHSPYQPPGASQPPRGYTTSSYR